MMEASFDSVAGSDREDFSDSIEGFGRQAAGSSDFLGLLATFNAIRKGIFQAASRRNPLSEKRKNRRVSPRGALWRGVGGVDFPQGVLAPAALRRCPAWSNPTHLRRSASRMELEGHHPTDRPADPSRSFPFSTQAGDSGTSWRIDSGHEFHQRWDRVVTSWQRAGAIQGALLGSVCGEWFGLRRNGLSRRLALSLFGRSTEGSWQIPASSLQCLQPALSSALYDAVLESQADGKRFEHRYARNFGWLRLAAPSVAGQRVRNSIGTGPTAPAAIQRQPLGVLPQSVLLASVAQGSGIDGTQWAHAMAATAGGDRRTILAAVLLAEVSLLAMQQYIKPSLVTSVCQLAEKMLRRTSSESWLPAWSLGIQRGDSPGHIARSLGWPEEIPFDGIAIGLMAIAAWMKHRGDLPRTVHSAIHLGGPSAILGSLSGALAGLDGIPAPLPRPWIPAVRRSRLSGRMARRLVDWPHGVNDLQLRWSMPIVPWPQFLRSGLSAIPRTLQTSAWTIARLTRGARHRPQAG